MPNENQCCKMKCNHVQQCAVAVTQFFTAKYSIIIIQHFFVIWAFHMFGPEQVFRSELEGA